MPESRLRRKGAFTPPPPKSSAPKPNPQWFAPLMVFFLLAGLAWVVVYYLGWAPATWRPASASCWSASGCSRSGVELLSSYRNANPP